MEFEEVRPFLEQNHRSVVTTHRPGGAAHSSIVVCGAYRDCAAFVSVHKNSVKVRNLRRDPRCTVLAVTKDWRSSVTVEGEAQLFDYANTEAEEIRIMLREVFRACGDSDHSDWEEYDRAMIAQEAVAVLVRPEKVVGMIR